MSICKSVRVEFGNYQEQRLWSKLREYDQIARFQTNEVFDRDVVTIWKVDAIWVDSDGKVNYRVYSDYEVAKGTAEELQAMGFFTMETLALAVREYVVNSVVD